MRACQRTQPLSTPALARATSAPFTCTTSSMGVRTSRRVKTSASPTAPTSPTPSCTPVNVSFASCPAPGTIWMQRCGSKPTSASTTCGPRAICPDACMRAGCVVATSTKSVSTVTALRS